MRISDWSSDVCSSDLRESEPVGDAAGERLPAFGTDRATAVGVGCAHVIPPEAKRRSRDRGLALLVLEGAEKLLDRTGSRRRRRVRLVAVVVAHPLHLVPHVSLIAAFRQDRKRTRLNSSPSCASRMPSPA